MSSLVSEFLINPVLRQARRFSEISRSTFAGDDDQANPTPAPDAVSDPGHAEDAAPEQAGAPSQTPGPRPLSTSTQETSVEEFEEATTSPAILDEISRDHLGFPPTPRKGRGIPEDDGMRELRRRIHAINDLEIPSSEKARLIHEALLEGYRASQTASRDGASPLNAEPAGPTWEHTNSARPLDSLKFWHSQFGDSPSAEKFVLSENDIAPTYAPIRQSKSPGSATPTKSPTTPPGLSPPLGCQHYERNVKLECSTCYKWYTCRFCHDAQEDHGLVRKDTRHMLCMLCGTPQKASDVCISCGEVAAQYYCNICKLWENRQSKPIYHCSDCGICRRGLGLGKDFFHCKTCRACITTSIQSSHKCIERSTDCNCPICGEYMFTSPKPVVFMNCGHSIHKKCYDQHMKVSYKCPICNKSLANMETQFRNMDVAIQSQPMPPEFRDTKATVLCNDCSGKCTVPYHWLGLKCSICRSYNTVELQIHSEEGEQVRAAAERPEPSVEATPQSSQDPSRPTAFSTSSRAAGSALLFNRRRHSSHGVELQYRAPDRIARSLSPLALGMDSHLPHMAVYMDSEDDILGFWRGNEEDGDEDSDDQCESDSDQDGSASAPDVDDDEDDDDDEIILIGHR
ncbi:zinc-ribbon domain-containing protein [Hirsutella rhossiliensis]|uniref:Zinc-ribbon domain-containing protein n=1 Tax=Hirsutella rhossiliensis TaxID=111463 RepID=A0A9P8SKZ5_9HYPO|nr:zinc-ribbon domain-containing protein [Hirsutella rhossiliensis]KAH0966421.1 zinc-ribbon domain-containing protein [Hirsutella rhossiliensis]